MPDFDQVKRIVIKIGTSTLTYSGDSGNTSTDRSTEINVSYFANIAQQVAELRKQHRQVIIVTSGAIGLGAKKLGRVGPVTNLKLRQACAAIGQPFLMQEYQRAFATQNLLVAQVLLTAEVLNQRRSFLNLTNSIETLLRLGIVPILNENDSVSTDEIGTTFGDNDRLSALVASKVDADLLIMLTDIDALYDKNPREFADAKPIRVVTDITADIEQAAGKKGSIFSTGGMKSKLEAVRIAAVAGCTTILADGQQPQIVQRIVRGEKLGTRFMAKPKMANRARWIFNCQPDGKIQIDEGALEALRKRKSLLPKGVTAVVGSFKAGDVVLINDVAKAITSLSADELRQISGKHSSEIRNLLSVSRRDVVATPEDIVFLDDSTN